MRILKPWSAALLFTVAAALLSMTAARAGAPPAAAADAAVTVRLEHFMFAPGTITVPVGASVHWQNLDGEPHTVVSLEGLFRSGALDQGDSYAFTFKTAGTYRYVCSIHPQMVGTIIVTAP